MLHTAILVAFIGFVVGGAWAQDSLTGSISGTISDSTGAVIVGATVTLTNTDRGQELRVLTTSSAGYFTATSLPLGTYTVKVTNPGFKTETVTGLVLHATDALTVNRTLVTGSVNEVITVTAAEAQLDLVDSTSAGLINGEQMNELVLNNRNYEQFLELQPGVVYGGATDQLYVGSTAPGGASNVVNFSVNGGRDTSNNWTVDGADNVDRGANLTLLTFPSADAIAEVKTLRGQYSAEFGRSASGQIDVVTKSGTNHYHGSAYEFWRNDILNANLWGNKLNQPIQPRSILRYNDFGESVGGPVRIPHIYNGKDKTFFEFSDETRRLVQYTSGTALVPTLAERSGDFSQSWYQAPVTNAWTQGPVAVCTAYNSANGVCTAYGDKVTTIDPTAQAYLKDIFSLIPAPPSTADLAAGLDPHSVAATVPNIYNDNQIFVRVDQTFGQKLNVFYRYLHDTFPINSGTGTFTTSPLPGLSNSLTTNPGTQQMGHVTYIATPTLLANLGFAYSSNAILTTPVGAFTSANSKDITPTLPYTNTLGVVPTLAISDIASLGSTGIYHDYDFNRNLFGDVTKTVGRHTIIAGATYNHYRKQENATGGNNGSFSFIQQTGIPTLPGLNGAYASSNAMANFLLGNANGGFSQASLAITADILEDDIEAFVQDNYKYSPRLSLNMGVRYGYYGQPTDGHNRMNNFDPATFDPTKAPAIMNSGLMCLGTALVPSQGSTCLNTNQVPTNPVFPGEGGSVTVNPNQDYDGINYINGMIFQNNSGVPGHPSPFGSKVGSTDNLNFAPRFGFAYDIFGDSKTSLRGGFGWAYDSSEVSFYETQVFNNPPAVTSYSLSTAVFDDPATGSGTTTAASTTPGRIVASPIDYKTPYIEQYSLDIQHVFSPTFMIDVGYFGTHGTKLLGMSEMNQPKPNTWVGKVSPQNATTNANPQYCFAGTSGATCIPSFLNTTTDRVLNSIRPYPGYFAIDTVEPIYSSNYNGLQVKVTKKFSGKSMIDANYTWSRDLTNAQNDYSTEPQNIYDLGKEYGRAADDRKQVLMVDGVYELPWMRDQRGVIGHLIGGWETSGILALNSGLPLTISESAAYTINYTYQGTAYTGAYNNQNNGGYITDAAGIGVLGNTNAGLRPIQIGNPNKANGSTIHNRYQWFYEGAFAAPPASNTGGLVGDEKRGVVSAPGFERVDLGLFRNIKLHEGVNVQIRGEAFNLFNHTNLGSPTTSASSSLFGQITGARDNRIMQIAGKFTF
jgi:hypothetical protein